MVIAANIRIESGKVLIFAYPAAGKIDELSVVTQGWIAPKIEIIRWL